MSSDGSQMQVQGSTRRQHDDARVLRE